MEKIRLRRIRDYEQESLQSPIPEVAILGGICADFARWQSQLGHTIEEASAACQTPRQYLERVPRGIEVALKIARQLERCMRLASLMAGPQHDATPDSPGS
jgi:hypothetical protein